MKQIALTMAAAMLLATLGSAAIYPSAIDEYSEGEHLRIEKTYILADEEDVSLVPTADFEREGCRYTLIDIVCRHDTDTDAKPHRETVTTEADSSNVEDARSLFNDTLTAETEDGYSGELYLDEESIAVSPSGYGVTTRAVSTTRSYPSLSDADISLLPKSIDEDGRTLTLADVQWTEVDNCYTATAEYTGTVQRRYVKGYTATAEYAGEVSKTMRDEVICTAVFSGTPIETELPDVYRTERDTEADTTRILLIVLPVAIGAIVITAIAVRAFEKRRKR